MNGEEEEGGGLAKTMPFRLGRRGVNYVPRITSFFLAGAR